MIHNAFMFKNKLKNVWNIFLDQSMFWLKMFLVQNIYLSYDSQNIQVQNTFLTDSKQIQNILEMVLDQKILDPNSF